MSLKNLAEFITTLPSEKKLPGMELQNHIVNISIPSLNTINSPFLLSLTEDKKKATQKKVLEISNELLNSNSFFNELIKDLSFPKENESEEEFVARGLKSFKKTLENRIDKFL